MWRNNWILSLDFADALTPHICLCVQEPKPKHVLVFQHIPLYLKSPEEEDDYFNLQRAVRQNLLDRFKKAGKRTGGARILGLLHLYLWLL